MKRSVNPLKIVAQVTMLLIALSAVVFLYQYVRSTEFIKMMAGVADSKPTENALVELAAKDLNWCLGDEQVLELSGQSAAQLGLCRVPIEAYLKSDGEILLTPLLNLKETKSGATQKNQLLGDLDKQVFSYKGLPFRSKYLAERILALRGRLLDPEIPKK